MRKGSNRQKNSQVGQLSLFTHTGEPAVYQTSGTGEVNLSGVGLSSRLEQQRTLTANILERIVDYGNLSKAYKQVRSNRGSSGIDGMEVDDLREWLGTNLRELQGSILEGSYRVNPVQKVEILKQGGGLRMLGMPMDTFMDFNTPPGFMN